MIDGATKLLGVLGWPVEHSMSPVMHNAAIQAAGLNACYVPFPCPPEALGDVIAGLRGMGFSRRQRDHPPQTGGHRASRRPERGIPLHRKRQHPLLGRGSADGDHYRRPRRRAEPPTGRHRARRQEGRDPGNRRRGPGAGLRAGPGLLRGRERREGIVPATGANYPGPGPGQGR